MDGRLGAAAVDAGQRVAAVPGDGDVAAVPAARRGRSAVPVSTGAVRSTCRPGREVAASLPATSRAVAETTWSAPSPTVTGAGQCATPDTASVQRNDTSTGADHHWPRSASRTAGTTSGRCGRRARWRADRRGCPRGPRPRRRPTARLPRCRPSSVRTAGDAGVASSQTKETVTGAVVPARRPACGARSARRSARWGRARRWPAWPPRRCGAVDAPPAQGVLALALDDDARPGGRGRAVDAPPGAGQPGEASDGVSATVTGPAAQPEGTTAVVTGGVRRCSPPARWRGRVPGEVPDGGAGREAASLAGDDAGRRAGVSSTPEVRVRGAPGDRHVAAAPPPRRRRSWPTAPGRPVDVDGSTATSWRCRPRRSPCRDRCPAPSPDTVVAPGTRRCRKAVAQVHVTVTGPVAQPPRPASAGPSGSRGAVDSTVTSGLGADVPLRSWRWR
jgi:hypothetical protein